MTINLSTRLFYDRSATAMQSLTARADAINTRINAQSNILAPSDGSVAWQRLQGIARATGDAETDAANVKLAQSVLQQADTTLGQMTEQLQKASELTIQARNGTLSGEARAAIATELDGIIDSLVALANTRDVRGGPLFGGASGEVAATRNANGSIGFADGEAAAIPIGDGQDVRGAGNARTFLSGPGGDIGSVLTAIVTALRAGEAVPASASDALGAIADQVTGAQSSLGARAARVELQAGQLQSAATDREATRIAVDGFDYPTAITELQQTMTILQATQASFSKLSQLSLFDYLR